MIERGKILEAVYDAFDQVNESLPQEKRLIKSEQTELLSSSGQIDSLGLTMLIVAIEQKVEEHFDMVITLVDSTIFSEENSPLQSVSKLVDFVAGLIQDKANV